MMARPHCFTCGELCWRATGIVIVDGRVAQAFWHCECGAPATFFSDRDPSTSAKSNAVIVPSSSQVASLPSLHPMVTRTMRARDDVSTASG